MHPASEPNQLFTIPFDATVSANSEKTVASKSIPFDFRTERFNLSFALNTNRTVKASWIISGDDNEPTTGKPSGQNPFTGLGHVDYFVGDDEQVDIRHQTSTFQRPRHVKLYLNNTDAFQHRVHGFVTIRANPTRRTD